MEKIMEEPGFALEGQKVAVPPDYFVVLKFLSRHSSVEACFPFAPITKATKLNRKRVRIACRALARKGWAAFYSGLCNDDGDFCGSGYCITHVGRSVLPLLSPSGARSA